MDIFGASSPYVATRRFLKPLLILVALCMALGLTIHQRGRLVLGAGELSVAAARDDKKPYDLTALHVFNSTLMRVNDSYVDPTRVDAKKMLLAALDWVQRRVAEVLVEPHPEQNRVVVRVDNAQQEFQIGEVDSPWTLSMKMREIFRFIQHNLPADMDTESVRNIEYAATNGMLSTLDPHSALLDQASSDALKMDTRGSFGGLGIVIGIRKNGALTVIRPMPNTPAYNAGIRANDRIVRIEKESTVNMMLNDAVSRMRGDPDTKVELWVERGPEKTAVPKKYLLTRAIIQVKTVEAHMLKNNVGYVKLFTAFANNTDSELRKSLEELKKQGMKALVLDLRNNPGGLLEQAVQIVDEFVDSGTIVTTVGFANKQREEKRATPGNQPHIPIALLINHGSASASEIVAGALKNLDRAVIVGTRTFGKGSVQLVYDNDDGSTLKLTIAQYLTPGDISIQAVGVTPDVLLDKVAINADQGVYLFHDYKGESESDFGAHLISKNTRTDDLPFATLKYLTADPPKKAVKALLRDDDNEQATAEEDDEEAVPEDAEEKFVEDYEIQFARDLVGQAALTKAWKRHEVLAASKAFFAQRNADEDAQVAAQLKKLTVDWTPVDPKSPEAQGKPQFEASLSSDHVTAGGANVVNAGDIIKLRAQVTNHGTAVAGQVRGRLVSQDPYFDGREFVFGRIKPGETRSFVVPVKVQKGALSRIDPLKLDVFDQRGPEVAATSNFLVETKGLPRPQFAYSYQLVDDIKGNGDGLAQTGESVRLHVTVKNIGTGRSNQTLAELRNLSDEGIYIKKGRFNVDHLAPGEEKTVDFTFDVKPEFAHDKFKVELFVVDSVFINEFITDKLTFPVVEALPLVAAQGVVSVTGNNVVVRAAATKDALVVGTAKHGAIFKQTGSVGGFYRVDVDNGRPGFIAESDAQPTPAASPKLGRDGGFLASWQVAPPKLELVAAAELVQSPTLQLRGKAEDPRKIADIFVVVSNPTAKIDSRKVFYQSNKNGSDPLALSFAATVPLWPGANYVTVVARENGEVQAQQTLVVTRQGEELAKAPDKNKLVVDSPASAH